MIDFSALLHGLGKREAAVRLAEDFGCLLYTSLTQMQRNQVVDTYEAVWLGVEENDIETLSLIHI